MTARKIAYLILILLSVMSCEKSHLTDEKVLGDILPQLIDSLGINMSNIIPPPPPPIFDKDSNFIGIDTIIARQILEEHRQLIKRIDSIDSRLLIGLADSSFTIDLVDLSERTYSDSLLIRQIIRNNENKNKSVAKWNVNLVDVPSGYELVLKSNLEEKYADIWRINDRKFQGLIAISKVYYNADLKTGLLQFETYPFFREGVSYFVIIERIGKQWKVKKILMNWIT